MHHSVNATKIKIVTYEYVFLSIKSFNLLIDLIETTRQGRGIKSLISLLPFFPTQTLVFVLIYFILSEHPVAFQGPLCSW